ncbi:hypothetical protein SD457_15360 [Coprobacillaceae bacterium CR2/5/TPMF4]|nr:hypothetical protein SD457_15360 [Coprobacillaceae bacterium CR2/5/TPMF4]
MVHRLDRETSGVLMFAKNETIKINCKTIGINLFINAVI